MSRLKLSIKAMLKLSIWGQTLYKYITKYTPPAFLEAKGNEDAPYSYNRERNESMFGMNLN